MGNGVRMRWGYTCSSEEFEASELAHHAVLAEDVGFDFVTVSDHFHPWTQSQGHSPFAWTTVGAIGALTRRVGIGTGVTCPMIRVHPAIVAVDDDGAVFRVQAQAIRLIRRRLHSPVSGLPPAA